MLNNPFSVAVVSMLLSLAPILIWAAIFLYKHNEKRHLVVRTFMLGALMVLPLVIYRGLWGVFPSIDLVETLRPLEAKAFLNIPLNIIILFITVGIIEECLKGKIVMGVENKEIKCIDDAIEFSIIAGLGFAFAENTFYFIEVWLNLGRDLLIQVVAFRSVFSSFAHVLFSVLFGYHLGLALFAKPLLKQKSTYLTKIISKITNAKEDRVFYQTQIFVGLFLASSLHAIFNILLGIGYTGFLIPFLIVGFIHVMFLISSKDNHVKYLTQ